MAGPILGSGVDDAQFRRLLEDLIRKTGDAREFFYNTVDPSITRFFERQFETSGAEGGETWAPIASLTQKLRSRRGHGHAGGTKPLWDTGQLRRDYVHATGAGFRKVDRREYQRGVVSLVAALQQTGWTSRSVFGQARKTPKKVPARKVVPSPMPRKLVDEWTAGLVRRLESGAVA